MNESHYLVPNSYEFIRKCDLNHELNNEILNDSDKFNEFVNKFIHTHPEHENDNKDLIKKVLRKSLNDILNINTYDICYNIPDPTNAETEIITHQPLTIKEWLNA